MSMPGLSDSSAVQNEMPSVLWEAEGISPAADCHALVMQQCENGQGVSPSLLGREPGRVLIILDRKARHGSLYIHNCCTWEGG